MKRIVILISGRGSNMQAIVQACVAQEWRARVVAVVSNNLQATGLEWAKAQGIDTQVVDHCSYESRQAFDDALMQVVDGYAPDLLVLAGFMRILTPGFVEHYAGKMVNIHPSLLPNFPGLDTHRRALEGGHSHAGATVHWVTSEVDQGAILAQVKVPILAGDTPDTLAKRVLEVEHEMYPRVVRELVELTL